MDKKRIIPKIINGELKLNKSFMKNLKGCRELIDYVPTEEEMEYMKTAIEGAQQNGITKKRLEEIHKSINELNSQKDISKTMTIRKYLGYAIIYLLGIVTAFVSSFFISSIFMIFCLSVRGILTGYRIKKLITNPNPLKVIKIDKKVSGLEQERLELICSGSKHDLHEKWANREKDKIIIQYAMGENNKEVEMQVAN